MTINATGNVSLGGSRIGESVNLEIAQSANSLITINDSYPRQLAGKPTNRSQISLSDFRGKYAQISDPPGPLVNFIFDADYISATYTFTDGSDMDTNTCIPAISQIGVGWNLNEGGVGNYLYWAGDNTGTGTEAAIIYLNNYKAAFPGATSITVEYRAMWYGSRGSNPVTLAVNCWKGGSPVQSGFNYINPTATRSFTTNGGGHVLQLQSTTDSVRELISTFTYTFNTFKGTLTTTP